MNRLIRVILYITAGCIGVGCAALILGFALGGANGLKDESVSKQFAYAVRDFSDNMRKKIHSNKTESDYEYAYTYEEAYDDDYDYDDYENEDFCVETDDGQQMLLSISSFEVQNIEIDLQHGSLGIGDTDDDKIQVVLESGPSDGISAECESGKLVIRDERKGSKRREDTYVYLLMPEDSRFKNLSIQAGAGSVETTCCLEAEHFTVSADAGEIYLNEIKADVFHASVGAGEMNIEDSVFDTVKLDCGIGMINLEADVRGNAQVDCGMGSVYVELEDDADSVDYVLKCGAGNIEIDGDNFSGFSKERHIDNGGSSLFTLNCGMGQICIE